MAMVPSSTLQFSNPFPSPLASSPNKQQSKPLLSFSTRAVDPETNTSDTTEMTPAATDNFDERLARLRYRSGTGKKAEARKGKRSKKSSSTGAVFLPPVPLKEPVSGGLKVDFGFTPYTERLNGRIAALGLAALLLVELASGKSVINYHTPSIIFIQIYFVAAVSAIYVKFEKEKDLGVDDRYGIVSADEVDALGVDGKVEWAVWKMPRYDDRHGSTRLYVGRLSSRTRSRDLENLFSRYGRVRDVDMKNDFAFIVCTSTSSVLPISLFFPSVMNPSAEFSDPRDADDARYSLNGREFDGSHILVEFAKGGPRGSSGSREYLGRGPPPGSGRCFNCGIDGHWARDCKSGDSKNKCYRCGERGHTERDCQNSPKKLNRSRSPPKRDRSVEHESKRSRSPRYNNSPRPKKTSPPPSKGRKRSPTPDESSPQERGSLSPRDHRQATPQNGSDYGESPRARSRSPERDSPTGGEYQSPTEVNGQSRSRSRSRSPSTRTDRSPVDDDDNRGSPRGSESPLSVMVKPYELNDEHSEDGLICVAKFT
ncbi:hypothetical protein HHK36_018333 [Tetracentron sinense]|uniref:Uncharacterized protein n=1 Tax=Tetracentron sinense TaxID=13715 RepID=A0A835DB63_TETSI|nr:hypothetical protein HHK36_018333 [Tetracentron sinense]